VGLRLQDTSLLHSATDIIKTKGHLPGEFNLQIKRTRRNSADVRLDNTVYTQINAYCRGLGLPMPTDRKVVRLTKGIRLNGRQVSAGDVAVFALQIPRIRSANAGDQSFRGVCSVVAFYQVVCGDVSQVFVEVVTVETASRVRSLFIINKIGLILAGATTTIIHADSVVSKLHMVPHFGDNDELIVGIPMWETR
jgi:hypothetical protein